MKTRSDVVIIWMHYVLCRNLMKSLGGEAAVTEKPTEMLPRNLGWNGEKQCYLLKYCLGNRVVALGCWVRGKNLECSLVTLCRSLKIGLPISVLVRNDMSMDGDSVDRFTDDLEQEFVCPFLYAKEEAPTAQDDSLVADDASPDKQ